LSAQGAARSIISLVLLIIGFFLLVLAAVDFLEGYGIVYALFLVLLGIIFLAVSGRV
jgi:hypothetical protein